MKRLIVIGAMEVETQGLVAKLTDMRIKKIGAFEVCEGLLCGVDVAVCRCGIGKVFSSAAASALLLAYPDASLVINLGVAGGIGKGLKQGDVAIAEKTVQHDYDQTPDGLPLGQVCGFDSPYFVCNAEAVTRMKEVMIKLDFKYVSGTIASGDQFVNSREKASAIANAFNAVACDMESAAIHQVCEIYKVPFLSMRAISDGGDDSAISSFYAFVNKAAERSIAAVTEFCQSL